MSTLIDYIFISKYHYPQKGSKALCSNNWPYVGTEKEQSDSGTSNCIKKQGSAYRLWTIGTYERI